MLIEQIIEFELRGLGLPGPTCTLTNGNFYEKKTLKENLGVDYYLSCIYTGEF